MPDSIADMRRLKRLWRWPSFWRDWCEKRRGDGGTVRLASWPLNPEGWWKLAAGNPAGREQPPDWQPQIFFALAGRWTKGSQHHSARHPLRRPSRAEFIARVPGGCAALRWPPANFLCPSGTLLDLALNTHARPQERQKHRTL